MKRLVLSFLLGGIFGGLLLSLFAFVFLHWYLGGSTPVTFENRSGLLLEAVSISGSGFKASLGEIRPNQTIRARVYPAGESSLRVEFRSNGQDFSVPMDEYLEGGGGYVVDIAVDQNLKVSVLVDSFSNRSLLLP
jgi:hypothetical protein